MYCFFDRSQNREAINVSPGEYFISTKGMLIHSLVGSCIAVAIYDPESKTGGLNHFIAGEIKDIKYDNIIRQAEESMNSLIADLVKNGCSKEKLEAKILGGSIFPDSDTTEESIKRSILFAEEYLGREKIKIVSRDTGGDEARKIYLYTDTFKVLLKRVLPNADLSKQMKAYQQRLKKSKIRKCS